MITAQLSNIQDFVNDPSFQNYVRKANVNDEEKWEVWLKNNPDKRDLFREAVSSIVLGVVPAKKGITIL